MTTQAQTYQEKKQLTARRPWRGGLIAIRVGPSSAGFDLPSRRQIPFSQAKKFTAVLEFAAVVDTSINNSNNLEALRKSRLKNDLHQPSRRVSKDKRSLSGTQASVLPRDRWSFPRQHDGTVVAGEV
jgi:hypothetical protein